MPRAASAGEEDHPGAFEQLVLLAVLRLGDRAYGMTVRREIEERSGRTIALGAVYATLDRLEHKGFVRSWAAGANDAPERGGRPRRFFRVEAAGAAALDRALAALDRMREGVRPAAAGATGSRSAGRATDRGASPQPTGRGSAPRPTGRARPAGAGA